MINSTLHDDDYDDNDCHNDAGGCDNGGCTGNHDIRYNYLIQLLLLLLLLLMMMMMMMMMMKVDII